MLRTIYFDNVTFDERAIEIAPEKPLAKRPLIGAYPVRVGGRAAGRLSGATSSRPEKLCGPE
jgi:hypothetical protein